MFVFQLFNSICIIKNVLEKIMQKKTQTFGQNCTSFLLKWMDTSWYVFQISRIMHEDNSRSSLAQGEAFIMS